MLDFLSDNIPKALLPMTVVVVGFAIVAASLYITKLVMLIEKRLRSKKPAEDAEASPVTPDADSPSLINDRGSPSTPSDIADTEKKP